MSTLHNAIWFTVHSNGSVQAEILYHMADSPITYRFFSWTHCFNHFRDILALIGKDVEIRVVTAFKRVEF